MTRKELLAKAEECVCGGRDIDYGSPEDSFNKISELWTAYLDTNVSSRDVAAMMILLKIARVSNSKNPDNWVDIAGYAACGGAVDTTELCGKA